MGKESIARKTGKTGCAGSTLSSILPPKLAAQHPLLTESPRKRSLPRSRGMRYSESRGYLHSRRPSGKMTPYPLRQAPRAGRPTMLTFRTPGPRLCDNLSRREAFHAGGLGLLGLSLPQLMRAQASALPVAAGRAQVLHRRFPHGRTAATFDLGPQARRTRGDSRRLRSHRDQRPRNPCQRIAAAPEPRGRQALHLAPSPPTTMPIPPAAITCSRANPMCP